MSYEGSGQYSRLSWAKASQLPCALQCRVHPDSLVVGLDTSTSAASHQVSQLDHQSNLLGAAELEQAALLAGALASGLLCNILLRRL